MLTKICLRCHVEKPLDDFAISKKSKTGHAFWCRLCMSQYKKQKRCEPVTEDQLRSLADKFWSKVDKNTNHPKGCWLWTGSFLWKGYGNFPAFYRTIQSHRFAYFLTYGPIPEGLFVCHNCDNPPCCRPDHLFLGTNDDNMKDSSFKGRMHQKLSQEDVVYIFNSRHTIAAKELAIMFRVHERHIYAIWYKERRTNVALAAMQSAQ